MHVATTTRRHGEKVYTTTLLRQSYRENGKVRHRTLANLSHLLMRQSSSSRPHWLVAPLFKQIKQSGRSVRFPTIHFGDPGHQVSLRSADRADSHPETGI